MKKLLIIHKVQFGYHTDIYKWCQYLNDKYEIELVCIDSGLRRFCMDNVHVHYVSRWGGRKIRGFRYILNCVFHISRFEGVIIVSYFYGCHLIKKMLPWKKMVLDIRTFDVSYEENVRNKLNSVLMHTVRKYDFATVISEGLRKQLPKDSSLTAILPLGSDIINTPPKECGEIDLLYVGIFDNRNLEKTIQGFKIALGKVNKKIHYHIIGRGFHDEEKSLKQMVDELGLCDHITFYGYISRDKLLDFYKKCNVGVSFVPITPYYDYQPVTKTFEYVMAGLFTIATATKSNVEVITPENGILINDTPEDFANAIVEISKMSVLDGDKIRNTFIQFQWRSIINNKMIPILNTVEQLFGYNQPIL